MSIKNIGKKTILLILDGFGISDNTNKNAIKDAQTPFLDSLFEEYPFTTINAGGEAVGLPQGLAGNSEVGHMNIGAGRAIRQDLVRINESISNNTFSKLEELQKLIKIAKENTKRIHIMGLLSDGGVHSHINHIKKIISSLSEHTDLKLFFHAFMDGRDTAPNVGAKYIKDLQDLDNFTFASMQGRSIAMDRDRRWEKIEMAYNTLCGQGPIEEISPLSYLESQYEKNILDEFITPNLFSKTSAIEKNDCIFFINFRPDRAIQLTLAFNDPSFNEFKKDFIPPMFLCMTPYVQDEIELPILFNKEKVKGGMTEYLSLMGKKQVKIAETEKYAHVTFFFNGGEKKSFKNEEHILIPSPKDVDTYDQKPEMSAPQVTSKLLEIINNDNIDFIVANYANSDMVGHTGKYTAAIQAIEVLDSSVKQVVLKGLPENYSIIITADHGNSDEMVYTDGTPHTAHTKALVPFSFIHKDLKNKEFKISSGEHSLMDICPTILYSLGLNFPKTFKGKNIFE